MTTELLALPPYGHMNTPLMWDVDTRRVPERFALKGRLATAVEWRKYVEALVAEVAEFLWPSYDFQAQAWCGAAQATARTLTEADLALLQTTLSTQLLKPVLTRRADQASMCDVTHKYMFQKEDEPTEPTLFAMLDLYLPTVPAEMLASLKKGVLKALGAFGPAPLRFKELLQRPRPYQVAFMYRRTHFSWELAKSSMTPSIPSGHSLQALIGFCSGYMAWRLELQDVAGATEALQQYSVDFGDRRVFAGVHYPSDNIASWFFALRLCDHLFGEAGQVAKDFMRSAIEKSAVFIAMDTVRAEADSPYALPMRRLIEEMARPAEKSEA